MARTHVTASGVPWQRSSELTARLCDELLPFESSLVGSVFETAGYKSAEAKQARQDVLQRVTDRIFTYAQIDRDKVRGSVERRLQKIAKDYSLDIVDLKHNPYDAARTVERIRQTSPWFDKLRSLLRDNPAFPQWDESELHAHPEGAHTRQKRKAADSNIDHESMTGIVMEHAHINKRQNVEKAPQQQPQASTSRATPSAVASSGNSSSRTDLVSPRKQATFGADPLSDALFIKATKPILKGAARQSPVASGSRPRTGSSPSASTATTKTPVPPAASTSRNAIPGPSRLSGPSSPSASHRHGPQPSTSTGNPLDRMPVARAGGSPRWQDAFRNTPLASSAFISTAASSSSRAAPSPAATKSGAAPVLRSATSSGSSSASLPGSQAHRSAPIAGPSQSRGPTSSAPRSSYPGASRSSAPAANAMPPRPTSFLHTPKRDWTTLSGPSRHGLLGAIQRDVSPELGIDMPRRTTRQANTSVPLPGPTAGPSRGSVAASRTESQRRPAQNTRSALAQVGVDPDAEAEAALIEAEREIEERRVRRRNEQRAQASASVPAQPAPRRSGRGPLEAANDVLQAAVAPNTGTAAQGPAANEDWLSTCPKCDAHLTYDTSEAHLRQCFDGDGGILLECPICQLGLGLMTDNERQRHVEECCDKGNLRDDYAIFRADNKSLPRDENSGLALECRICFEDFESGSSLCRLSCACVYHALCVEDWWRTGGRFCPLHVKEERNGAFVVAY